VAGKQFVAIGLLCLAIGNGHAGAGTVTIGATKDNTLYENGEGTISNGSGSRLFAGKTAVDFIRRGLIAFDIAGNVPAGSTIQSVVLTLNMSRTVSGPQTVQLRRVLADWGEGASNALGEEGQGTLAMAGDATWLHTFFAGAMWATPGGDFSATVSGSRLVGSSGVYNWSSTPQMVADVQDWLDNPGTNFGWILIGNESTTTTAKRFDSRNHPTASVRPRLTIEFVAEDPCPLDDPDDTDGDGVCDSDDICPGGNDNVDTDGDGTPNFCDPCPADNPNDSDGDGVCNSNDVCPGGNDNVDTDGDGTPNFCDPCPTDNPNDSDGDGVCNSSDVCPGGNDLVDADGDGRPDFCDACPADNPDDSDGDGVCNSTDICPGGDDGTDADGDGVPDFCDPCPLDNPDDTDGDGFCDSEDLCPGDDDALDANGDGLPDCLVHPAIPTVSDWGLMATALLFLTLAKLRGRKHLSLS